MKRLFASVLCTALLATGAVASTGCKASASIGSKDKAKPPPPPPPAPAPPPAAPAPPPPAPNKFKMRGEVLQLPGPILFETNSAVLRPESTPVLEYIKEYMASEDTSHVTLFRIEGHTDSDGNDAQNVLLSQQRALSVSKWLVGQGVDCKRILPVGFGESKPVASNDTEDGKQKNRRTVVANAAADGKPIKDMPVDGGGTPAGDPCN